jgi:hypothetical protein
MSPGSTPSWQIIKIQPLNGIGTVRPAFSEGWLEQETKTDRNRKHRDRRNRPGRDIVDFQAHRMHQASEPSRNIARGCRLRLQLGYALDLRRRVMINIR